MEVARGLNIGDEVDIDMRPGLTIESMTGLRLLRKGPVDWRQYKKSPTSLSPVVATRTGNVGQASAATVGGQTVAGRAHENIDLDFRPESYWDQPGGKHANVKGQLRRRAIAASEVSGDADLAPPEVREESISDADKSFLQLMHPSYRAGEDLPDYPEGEVEIARLAYTQTVHCEVTSIRARRESGRIRYRVVDEYDSQITCARQWSDRPLTLRELIELIDSSSTPDCEGLYFGDLNSRLNNEETAPDELEGFIEVSSLFYPNIGACYERAFKAWCEARISERTKDRPRRQ
jgi:hypothetical protein